MEGSWLAVGDFYLEVCMCFAYILGGCGAGNFAHHPRISAPRPPRHYCIEEDIGDNLFSYVESIR